MVAVNLLASLLTTNNLGTSIGFNIIACIIQWQISSNIVCHYFGGILSPK